MPKSSSSSRARPTGGGAASSTGAGGGGGDLPRNLPRNEGTGFASKLRGARTRVNAKPGRFLTGALPALRVCAPSVPPRRDGRRTNAEAHGTHGARPRGARSRGGTRRLGPRRRRRRREARVVYRLDYLEAQ